MTTIARVRLCLLDELQPGLGRPFQVGSVPLAVFRNRSDRVFAIDAVCPHRGGPLADGMLAGDQVVCPYHAFRFDSASGECDQPGTCSIRTFPVEVEDGAVFVQIEAAHAAAAT
jgi:nitrite reductase (NADH) small subunit